jgi:hypothetical protein
MQLPISVMTAVITLLSPILEAPSTSSAAPSVRETSPSSRAALPGGAIIHCGTNPLSENDVVDAYLDLASRANVAPSYWLDGSSSAFGKSGGAQFFICNNARSKRFFSLDTSQLQTLKSTFEQCGSNNFYTLQADNWSYGVDTNGNAECGNF